MIKQKESLKFSKTIDELNLIDVKSIIISEDKSKIFCITNKRLK